MGRPFVCAGSESRTRTPLLAYAPETYASTNSAIPAKDVSKAGAKISAFLSDAKFFSKRSNFFLWSDWLALVWRAVVAIGKRWCFAGKRWCLLRERRIS